MRSPASRPAISRRRSRSNPSFSRARDSGSRDNPTTGQRVQNGATVSDWLVPIDLTYEVDVWGRVRRGLESARAQAVASADDEAAVRLAVQTDVAQFYYTLRLLDAQVEILTQTVAAYREQVRVLSVQVKTGLVGPMALYQAQAQLEATSAQQRDLARARADQEHALAILCGQPAPSFTVAVNPLREARLPTCRQGCRRRCCRGGRMWPRPNSWSWPPTRRSAWRLPTSSLDLR